MSFLLPNSTVLDLENSLQVLLVEDDLLAAKLVRVILGKGGVAAETTHVTTIESAKDKLARRRFDVILLDLNLPDSNTEETLQHSVSLAEMHPVIVLTGNDSEEVGVRAVQLGAQDYLVKGEYNDRMLLRALRYARERHRMRSMLRRLSVIDELSGLYNRRGFFAVAGRQFKEQLATNDGKSHLFFFDLDRFKEVNDTFGHEQGDEALRSFSDLLKTVFDRDDLVARVGGDEFVAFVADSASRNPEEILKEFETALSRFNAEGKFSFAIQSSYGYRTVVYGEKITLDQALCEADSRLYEQKKMKKKEGASLGP
ncbi:MAG: diguanylate cyclase [Verrucomicrobiota bacterium]